MGTRKKVVKNINFLGRYYKYIPIKYGRSTPTDIALVRGIQNWVTRSLKNEDIYDF